MKNQKYKIRTEAYGLGYPGHAIRTDKLNDAKLRYVIVSDIIKKMEGV